VYLDSAAARRLEQHIFWLHITVNDMMIVEQHQTLEHRVRELADQSDTEALKLVLFDELIEIHRQQLERDADVTSKREMFVHVNDISRIVCVDPAQLIEDADFFLRLSVKPFFIADHFQGHADAVLVVESVYHLPKTTFTNDLEDFVAVGNMIVWYLPHTSTNHCKALILQPLPLADELSISSGHLNKLLMIILST